MRRRASASGTCSASKVKQRAVVDALGHAQERPVRTPHAPVRPERVDQSAHVGQQVAVGVGLPGHLDAAGELHDRAPRRAPPQQLPEPRGAEPGAGIGPAAVVDVHAHAGALQQGRELHQLVVDDLDVGDHVQRREVGQQPARVGVVPDAQERRVDRDAQDPRRPQLCELGARGGVRDHGHPAVAARRGGEGVEQAAVVLAVARVGPDEQRVLDAVRVQHRAQPGGRAQLLPGGRVERVRPVREPLRVEDVHVAVDDPLRLHGPIVVHRPRRGGPAPGERNSAAVRGPPPPAGLRTPRSVQPHHPFGPLAPQRTEVSRCSVDVHFALGGSWSTARWTTPRAGPPPRRRPGPTRVDHRPGPTGCPTSWRATSRPWRRSAPSPRCCRCCASRWRGCARRSRSCRSGRHPASRPPPSWASSPPPCAAGCGRRGGSSCSTSCSVASWAGSRC